MIFRKGLGSNFLGDVAHRCCVLGAPISEYPHQPRCHIFSPTTTTSL